MDPISGAKTSLSVLIPAPLEIDSSYKEIKGEFSKHDNWWSKQNSTRFSIDTGQYSKEGW